MRMFGLVIFLLVIVTIELYAYFGFRSTFLAQNVTLYNIVYLLSTLITLAAFAATIWAFQNHLSNQPFWINLLMGLAFAFVVAKLIASIDFFAEDVLRGFLWLFQTAGQFRMAELLPRSQVWGKIVVAFAMLIWSALIYGVAWGKYHYKVHHVTLEYENLPDGLDGLKIAQLSDLHLGSFDSKRQVKRGLQLLQDQNPDLILFTGDMVNHRAKEALPYVDAFAALHAPLGKFTIMGNHDYGDYVRWADSTERKQNSILLHEIEAKMGFVWLNNTHQALTKGGDTLYLVGVENWGKPPFPQYGNLQKAIDSIPHHGFTVLMSHDPSHFQGEVVHTAKPIALTLSGHTHGMQFGIELGRFKWSPVKYKYPQWAGLYFENNCNLYINRGFGHIGYPGRVGIRPEITIINLKKKSVAYN